VGGQRWISRVALLDLTLFWSRVQTFNMPEHNLTLQTGELSLDEFVAGARSDEDFMEVMMKSLDLRHIVAMIHNRRHSV